MKSKKLVIENLNIAPGPRNRVFHAASMYSHLLDVDLELIGCTLDLGRRYSSFVCAKVIAFTGDVEAHVFEFQVMLTDMITVELKSPNTQA